MSNNSLDMISLSMRAPSMGRNFFEIDFPSEYLYAIDSVAALIRDDFVLEILLSYICKRYLSSILTASQRVLHPASEECAAFNMLSIREHLSLS